MSVRTEMPEAIKLSAPVKRFIQHWGEMGTKWGVNRTVAQVHALLIAVPRPLTAEEIQATLGVARSNVSTSLRELQDWGLVHSGRELGDRKDRFETLDDAWEMFRIIGEQRKRRELDPTRDLLRQCVDELRRTPADREAGQRIGRLLELVETLEDAYQEMRTVSMSELRNLLKLRGGLRRLFRPRRA